MNFQQEDLKLKANAHHPSSIVMIVTGNLNMPFNKSRIQKVLFKDSIQLITVETLIFVGLKFHGFVSNIRK